MMVNTYSSTRTRRPHTIAIDTITVELVCVILLGVAVFSGSAFLRNGQRKLTDEIRHKEAEKAALLRDLQAERSLWHRCSNAAAIAQRLADRGYTVSAPDSDHIVYARPVRGSAPGRILLPPAAGAVASR